MESGSNTITIQIRVQTVAGCCKNGMYLPTENANHLADKKLIDEYIWFYNNERIQLKTKLTPLEQRRQLAV